MLITLPLPLSPRSLFPAHLFFFPLQLTHPIGHLTSFGSGFLYPGKQKVETSSPLCIWLYMLRLTNAEILSLPHLLLPSLLLLPPLHLPSLPQYSECHDSRVFLAVASRTGHAGASRRCSPYPVRKSQAVVQRPTGSLDAAVPRTLDPPAGISRRVFLVPRSASSDLPLLSSCWATYSNHLVYTFADKVFSATSSRPRTSSSSPSQGALSQSCPSS